MRNVIVLLLVLFLIRQTPAGEEFFLGLHTTIMEILGYVDRVVDTTV